MREAERGCAPECLLSFCAKLPYLSMLLFIGMLSPLATAAASRIRHEVAPSVERAARPLTPFRCQSFARARGRTRVHCLWLGRSLFYICYFVPTVGYARPPVFRGRW